MGKVLFLFPSKVNTELSLPPSTRCCASGFKGSPTDISGWYMKLPYKGARLMGLSRSILFTTQEQQLSRVSGRKLLDHLALENF